MDRDVLLARLGELLRSTLEEHQVATLPLGAETPLVGPCAVVTSLVFVQFVADVEAVLSEEFGREVILVSEEALSRRHSPFRTLGTLVDYVLELSPLAA